MLTEMENSNALIRIKFESLSISCNYKDKMRVEKLDSKSFGKQ